jgi:hypothetical protein
MDKREQLVRRLLKVAGTAMRAAKELFRAGLRTPKAVLASDRGAMISAFGRAHYVRYDESSATRLTNIGEQVRDEYSGDLRNIARHSDKDVGAAKRLLTKFNGIGNTGADIYLREVQDVWTWVHPYFDERAIAAAKQLDLPTDPAALGNLAPRANARLAAALVRTALDDVRRQVTG